MISLKQKIYNGNKHKKSLLLLPDEMAVEILNYLWGNKDMIALRACCKQFKALGDEYGYLRHLNLSMNADYMNLMVIWGRSNLKGLRSLSVNGFNSPVHWIPFAWPMHTLFSNCRMGSSLISPPMSPTTELRITEFGSGRTLRMDWSKVPKLRVLELHVYDADISKLVLCQGLEHLRLYFKSGKTGLPGWVADLPNLTTIQTNLIPETKMHFLSKKLRVCLVPKRKRINGNRRNWKLPDPCKCGWERCVSPYKNSPYEHFTAESTLVPWRHLLCEGYTLRY
jgi:hypothetical protein